MSVIRRGVSEINPRPVNTLFGDDLKDCTLKTKNGVNVRASIDAMTSDGNFKGHFQMRDDFLYRDPEIERYIINDIFLTKNLHVPKAVFHHPYEIKNVIFNDPATIVFWQDGTKTVVKAQDGDEFDPEKGLAMAIAKKVYGNQGNYCNQLKKWLPKEEPVPKFRFIFHTNKVNPDANTVTIKKRMTFREEVAKLEPERISRTTFGGVRGCPRDQDTSRPCPIDGTKMTTNERCRKCWDREIPEELMRDDI